MAVWLVFALKLQTETKTANRSKNQNHARSALRAEEKGLITRDLQRVVPTTRGFDFLSDLQALFLPET